MANLERIDVAGYGLHVDRRERDSSKPYLLESVPLVVIETKLDNMFRPTGVDPIQESSSEPPPGSYPGGAQVEGWSPLRRRTPWQLQKPRKWTERLFQDWYKELRSEIAVWLEVIDRTQPRFFGVPIPIYTFPAIAFLISTALLIPGPALYNIALIPILLFGGKIRSMDIGVVLVIQPLLWALKKIVQGYLWAADLLFGPKGKEREEMEVRRKRRALLRDERKERREKRQAIKKAQHESRAARKAGP